MPTTKTISYVDRTRFNKPAVYSRADWSDAWTLHPYLVALNCSQTTGRSISQALLIHDYGEMKTGDDFSTVVPLAILDKWVMIEWEPQNGIVSGEDASYPYQRWYGIAVDESIQELGNDPTTASGRQTIVCYGMEWALTRKQITNSYVLKSAGTAAVSVGFGIQFNGGRSLAGLPQEIVGNQANVLDSLGKKVFDDRLSNPRTWNAKEIVDYLLHYHNPFSSDLSLSLGGSSKDDLAAYTPAEVHVHGRTLFDILNQVIDYRRGLVWHLEVDDASDTISVMVESVATADTAISGTSFSITANARQVNLQIADRQIIRQLIRHRSTQRQFERVIAEGARIGYLFTKRCGESTFEKTWVDQDILDYHSAASGSSGYSGLNLEDKKNRNDSLRMNSPDFGRVFCEFKLADSEVVDYVYNEEGTRTLISGDTWYGGWNLEQSLPLREGWDYSTIPPTANSAGSYSPLMEPFAFAKLDGKTYTNLTKPSTAAFSESHNGGIQFSVQVVPCSRGIGVRLSPSVPPHILGGMSANGNTTGVDVFDQSTAEPSDFSPQGSWSDVYVTFCMTTPQTIRCAHPSPAATVRHNMESELLLRFGDRAHYDYCVTETTFQIEGNSAKTVPAGTIIRDDREFLRAMSQAAWLWYSTARKSVELSVGILTSLIRVGQLLTQVNETTGINSIVTDVVWDFSAFTTQVRTEFAELDFESIGIS